MTFMNILWKVENAIINFYIKEEMEFQEFKRSYLKGMADEEYEDGNVSAGDDMAPKEK